MNTNKQFIQIKTQINKLGMVTDSSHNYRTSLLSLLREAVPFDAACCTHVDPQTLLSTGAVTEDNVERIHPYLFQIEYGEDDVNSYEQMVHNKQPRCYNIRSNRAATRAECPISKGFDSSRFWG